MTEAARRRETGYLRAPHQLKRKGSPHKFASLPECFTRPSAGMAPRVQPRNPRIQMPF